MVSWASLASNRSFGAQSRLGNDKPEGGHVLGGESPCYGGSAAVSTSVAEATTRRRWEIARAYCEVCVVVAPPRRTLLVARSCQRAGRGRGRRTLEESPIAPTALNGPRDWSKAMRGDETFAAPADRTTKRSDTARASQVLRSQTWLRGRPCPVAGRSPQPSMASALSDPPALSPSGLRLSATPAHGARATPRWRCWVGGCTVLRID